MLVTLLISFGLQRHSVKEVEEMNAGNNGNFLLETHSGDQGGPLVTYDKCHVCPQVSHLMMVRACDVNLFHIRQKEKNSRWLCDLIQELVLGLCGSRKTVTCARISSVYFYSVVKSNKTGILLFLSSRT